MAQTKIWDTNSPYKTLWYIMNEKKTRSPGNPLIRYVSRLNCFGEANLVAHQFQETKSRFRKDDGVQAYHAEQSFKPGEVTPELAHQIGVQLAQELWGEKYEVVVATHVDKGHIHNHFCFNSVSFRDGHKFHDCLDFYAHMREVSDRICQEHELSVIVNPDRSRKKGYKTWQREQEGQTNTTVRDWIREDIDKVLPEVGSLSELYDRLAQLRYTVDTNGKYVKVRPKGKDRFFRLYKLGKGYAEEDLYDRIEENKKEGYHAPKKMRGYSSFTFFRVRKLIYLGRRQRHRPGSIMATYLCYRHLLKNYLRKKYPTPEPSLTLREDARELRRFSEKTYLLCANGIHSEAQLTGYLEALEQTAKAYGKERQQLRSRLARTVNPQEQAVLRQEIAALTEKIRSVAREEKLGEEILAEAAQVKGKSRGEAGQLQQEQEITQETERKIQHEQ